MSQALSSWAKQMIDDLNRWTSEADPEKKAQLRAEWEKKVFAGAKPKRTK